MDALGSASCGVVDYPVYGDKEEDRRDDWTWNQSVSAFPMTILHSYCDFSKNVFYDGDNLCWYAIGV